MTTVSPTNVQTYLYLSNNVLYPINNGSGGAPSGLYVTWNYNGTATFTITPYVNGLAQTALITTSSSTNKIFTNLTLDTSYSFSVAATNGGITSTPSLASNIEKYTNRILYNAETSDAKVSGSTRINDTPIDVIVPSKVYIASQLYNVTRIGPTIFDFNGQCARLSSIYMPDSLIDLGVSVFSRQIYLKSIRYSSNIPYIQGQDVSCGLETIDITNCKNLTAIGSNVWIELPNLTKILIGSSVTSIGNSGFNNNGTLLPSPNTNHRSTKLDVYFYGTSIPTIDANNFKGLNNTFHYPCIAYVLPNTTNLNRIISLVNSTYGNASIFSEIKVFLPEPTNVTGYLYQSSDNSFPTGIILSWEGIFNTSSYLINIYASLNDTIPIKIITTNSSSKTYTITSSDNLISGTYYFTVQSNSQADNVTSIESVKTSAINYNLSLKYKIYNSSTASISGSLSDITTLSLIPSLVKIAETNYNITSISDNTFINLSSLITVNISSNIQTIGVSAFENCVNLTNVTLTTGITSIGNNSFKNCSSLTSIILPSSLSSLGSSVFHNCIALSSISISSTNVTSILASAFNNCNTLTTIELPTNLTAIDVTAFLNCNQLTSISINSNNSYFSSQNGILFNKTKTSLLFYPAKIINTYYTILSSILSLEDYCFHDNYYLRELNFNTNIQTVGKYVFNNIDLNMSFFNVVPTFDSLSFSNNANICYKLSTTTNISNLSINNFTEIRTITAPTNIKLYPYIANLNDNISGIFISWNNSISSISSAVISLYLSNTSNSLSSFNIINPSSVTYFIINSTELSYNQSYRVKITITLSTGDFLTSDYSFTLYYTNNVVYTINNNNCIVSGFKYSPTSIIVSSQIQVNQTLYNVTGIGSMAFRNCISLRDITIPETIISIESYAFENCNQLTTINFTNNISLIKKGVFKGCLLLNNIIFPLFVTSLYEEVFMNCASLTSITLSPNLTKISKNTFNGCSKLLSITIPELLTNIDPDAFVNCNKFEEMIVSENNSNYLSINGILFNKENNTLNLFPMGKNISTYTIPNNITTIGNYAFQQSLYLTTINLNNVTTIGLYAFKSCVFTSITLPDTLNTIGNGSFSYCENLTTFIVNTSHPLYSVSDGILFSKDKKTLILYPVGKTQTSYTIPLTVENISASSFESSQNLTNIILHKNIKTIGDSAFRSCINILNMSIPSSVISIGTNAFADNPGLKISFLSNTPLIFNLPSLNIVILSDLVKLLEDSGVNFTGDVIVNVEISAAIINNTFIFKTTTPNSFDLTTSFYKVNGSINGYDDVIPKIETSVINYDGGVTSGYISPSQEISNLPYEYLCYISHIKNNTTNGIRGILQVNTFISNMATKINNAFKSILQNLSNIEQAYSDSSNILALSILQEINVNDPSRLFNIPGTSLGNNWYPNLVQPGDYLYYTVTIEPHPQQTGITQNRVYLFKAKVV